MRSSEVEITVQQHSTQIEEEKDGL